jgi:hypothetical protein
VVLYVVTLTPARGANGNKESEFSGKKPALNVMQESRFNDQKSQYFKLHLVAPKSEISHTYKNFNKLDFKRKYSKIPCIPDSDMEIFSALPVR